jgi:hypothetical protein
MKKIHNTFLHTGSTLLLVFLLVSVPRLSTAQSSQQKQRILVDVAHGQRFWNDPSAMSGKDANLVTRINYMNGELVKNATSLKAEVSYLKGKITPGALGKGDVLFIHIPSAKYDADEVKAIQQHVRKGGSLFLVMDADYWSTLEQTNVNDILSPYNIKFGANSPVTGTGGRTKAGLITQKDLVIPYHGARLVEGGTPFGFNNQTEEHPFGAFIQVKGGGKIIAMGDGMVSLYMTAWEGVDNYQCSEFMHDTFAWLLK